MLNCQNNRVLKSLISKIPTKALGQNFLVSCKAQSFLLDTMRVIGTGQSIELCSGYGALTVNLYKAQTRLVGAIEIDGHVAFLFSKRFSPIPPLFMTDALVFSFKRTTTGHHLALLGNISFSITKNLLPNILGSAKLSFSLILMLYAADFNNLVRRACLSSFLSYSLGFRTLTLYGPQHFFPCPMLDCSFDHLHHHFEMVGRYELLSV